MTGWIDVAGWTLVHAIWQAALLAGVAALLLRALRHGEPEARYAAACVALLTMFAAPFVTALLLSEAIAGPAPRAGGHAASLAQVSAPPVSASPLSGPQVSTPLAPGAAAGSAQPARETGLTPRAAWRPTIVAIWLTGVALLLLRLAGGWWRVRRLHRASLAAPPSHWAVAARRMAAILRVRRAIHVVDLALVDTPLVIGWMRPVIVLPIAALTNLSAAQVDAILAHELAHIRRHDYLVNLLQTCAETLLFYHPAVWWMSSRIRLEREHCCDRVAVQAGGDPVGYAEALIDLERWRSAHSPLALAATGGVLLDRIRRVLGVPSAQPAPRTSVAAVLALVMLLLVVAGATRYLGAQSAPGNPTPEPATPASFAPVDAVAWRMVFNHGDSELNIIGFSGRDLIRFAYQVPDARVLGGPTWIDDETFRLAVPLAQAPAADELPGIVRDVLESRFNLRTHGERRALPVYALVMARADRVPGPSLRVSTAECFDVQAWIAAGMPQDANSGPPRPGRPTTGQRRIVCGEETWDSSISRSEYVGITMAQFASEMRGLHRISPRSMGGSDRDVVDRTGLPGRYDVEIRAFLPAAALMAHVPIFKTLFEPLGLPSMPTALEQQLGLTLEDSTAPGDVIVIDHAERPSV